MYTDNTNCGSRNHDFVYCRDRLNTKTWTQVYWTSMSTDTHICYCGSFSKGRNLKKTNVTIFSKLINANYCQNDGVLKLVTVEA